MPSSNLHKSKLKAGNDLDYRITQIINYPPLPSQGARTPRSIRTGPGEGPSSEWVWITDDEDGRGGSLSSSMPEAAPETPANGTPALASPAFDAPSSPSLMPMSETTMPPADTQRAYATTHEPPSSTASSSYSAISLSLTLSKSARRNGQKVSKKNAGRSSFSRFGLSLSLSKSARQYGDEYGDGVEEEHHAVLHDTRDQDQGALEDDGHDGRAADYAEPYWDGDERAAI
ncbi:hypothetical protein C8J57DRAFT_1310196 [Mycena rebaudengoi]|nr:hypothetical protein C8J57DRAFT_1310196 [Mycena rebaudengoi]